MSYDNCEPDSRTIILVQVPFIQKIIDDECWYEGERVHHTVYERDIEDRICKIILSEGEKLRKRAIDTIRNNCNKDCKKCNFYKGK